MTNSLTKNNQNIIITIYLGGTFGCVGNPLAPIEHDVFFIHLNQYTHQHQLPKIASYHHVFNLKNKVMDSTQATPSDIASLMLCIEKCSNAGFNKIMVIQGTDTLSYSAALMAYAYQKKPIDIVFVASMQPFLIKHGADSTKVKQPKSHHKAALWKVNNQSDAAYNVTMALKHFEKNLAQSNQNKPNVYIAIKTLLPAINTQKIQRNQMQAFSNHPIVEKPLPPLIPIKHIIDSISNIYIASYYCVPQSAEQMSLALNQLIQAKPDAIILIGYGAGNFPYHQDIEKVLNTAYLLGIMVIINSQVPFGYITNEYEAGHWLQNCHVLSSQTLTIPSCYAKLLWICANNHQFLDRYAAW